MNRNTGFRPLTQHVKFALNFAQRTTVRQDSQTISAREFWYDRSIYTFLVPLSRFQYLMALIVYSDFERRKWKRRKHYKRSVKKKETNFFSKSLLEMFGVVDAKFFQYSRIFKLIFNKI